MMDLCLLLKMISRTSRYLLPATARTLAIVTKGEGRDPSHPAGLKCLS